MLLRRVRERYFERSVVERIDVIVTKSFPDEEECGFHRSVPGQC